MIISDKEALYNIHHEEQLFEWREITETVFKEHVQYFLDVLRGYDYSKADEEQTRLNRKYGNWFN